MSVIELPRPGLGYKIAANFGYRNDSNLFWHHVPQYGINFGDWIGPYLFQKITNRIPVYYRPSWGCCGGSYFSTVGSVLHLINRSETAIVWGSGAIRIDARFPKPKEILAVRGPLSRKVCVQQGYKCPEKYGDPAVLLPLYFDQTNIGRVREIGIVPHYVDFEIANRLFGKSQDVKIIDVKRKVEDVLVDIASCEFLVSSSLHGLIVAHSLGIRSAWVEFSDGVIGGGFKFRDYYASVGVENIDPTFVSIETTLGQLLDIARSSPFPDLSRISSDITKACPF